MKTLSKLCINPKKRLQDQELKTLKGGYWCGTCSVYYEGELLLQGPGCGANEAAATATCIQTYWPLFGVGVTCECD